MLISLGIIGLLLGLLGAAAMTITKTGLTTQSVQAYYLGTAGDGPDAELTATGPRPFDELAEVTHLHLMGGSLLLFFLCHLLSLCDVSENTRIVLYVGAFVTFLLTFGLPWLIIYGSPGFARAFPPSIVGFMILLVVVSLIPLKEMWLGRR
ncbi:MAG: hypothetical protein U0136_18310 [Bdellovibrionota bacterium]